MVSLESTSRVAGWDLHGTSVGNAGGGSTPKIPNDQSPSNISPNAHHCWFDMSKSNEHHSWLSILTIGCYRLPSPVIHRPSISCEHQLLHLPCYWARTWNAFELRPCTLQVQRPVQRCPVVHNSLGWSSHGFSHDNPKGGWTNGCTPDRTKHGECKQ